MSAIQTLIDEGVLVLWHDYRSGHADDLSGQGNDGTPSGVVWSRDGARFGSAGKIVVANSAELEAITSGCIICGGQYLQNPPSGTYRRLLEKEDAGGRQFSLMFNQNLGILMVGSSGPSQELAYTFAGESMIGVNFGNGLAAELFVSGTLRATSVGVNTIASDDAPITIGAKYTGANVSQFPMADCLTFNRVLTPSEHAAVYAELADMRWPQKQSRAATAYDGAATQLQWGTDWGTPVTENRTAGQRVGPFEIISGTHKVVTDTIEGKICKAIECVVSGVDSISGGAMRQTPDEMAYGTWDWWEYTPAIAVSNFGIVCQNPIKAVAGDIQMQMNGGTALAHLQNPATATIVGSMPFTPDQWNNWRITRSAANVFVVYLNGAQMGTATYAGVTSGKYSTVDQDTGCKRSLADVGAGHSMLKYQGVVAP
jgi:hypothetical protein